MRLNTLYRKMLLAAAAFAALALLQGCSPEGGSPAAASSPTFDEVISSRRSIRDYQAGTTISEAGVRTLISTAQDAPSWANTQTTRYYVALSEEKVAAVKELIGPFNAKNTANAPVMIVSTFVTGRSWPSSASASAPPTPAVPTASPSTTS